MDDNVSSCHDCTSPLEAPFRICYTCWIARKNNPDRTCVFCGDRLINSLNPTDEVILAGPWVWCTTPGKNCPQGSVINLVEVTPGTAHPETTDMADW